MAYKEINIFSISFLDLICGALGAVILLFIIVPKLDQKSLEDLEALSRVDLEITSLEQLLEDAKNSIPNDIYNELVEKMTDLQNAVDELGNEVQDLRRANEEQSQRIEELLKQIEEQNQEIVQIQERLQDCNVRMEEIEAEGRFAVVTMSWATTGDDIDLHITDPTGAEFYYRRPTISGRPGKLTRDDTYGPGVEVWQIPVIQAGTYKIEANLFESKSDLAPFVETWVYYRNGNRRFLDTLTFINTKKKVTDFRVNSNGDLSFY